MVLVVSTGIIFESNQNCIFPKTAIKSQCFCLIKEILVVFLIIFIKGDASTALQNSYQV